MINLTMFKRNWQANWRVWLFYTLSLIIMTSLVLLLYDPVTGFKDIEWFNQLPEKILLVLGIQMYANTLTGYLSSFLFGILYLVIPMLYGWLLINRLVTKPLQNGMMSFYLSAPIHRRQFVFTQAFTVWIHLFLMFFSIGVSGVIYSLIWLPGSLNFLEYLLLFAGLLSLHLCLSGISFLIACICEETSSFIKVGAGIPLIFFLLLLISRLGGKWKVLQYVTVFSLFRTDDVITGSLSVYFKLLAAILLGIVFYMMGIKVFEKKDLPL